LWTIFGLVLCSAAAHAQDQGDTIRITSNKRKVLIDSIQQYVRINQILISGNKRTRTGIIQRELRLKQGDIVGDRDLEYVVQKDQQKIFNLHLFNTVVVKPLKIDTGLVNLEVIVTERWYTFPVPRFQLSDRNFNEWWQNYGHDLNRVNYGLKLYQYNLWGRNHTLLLKTQFGFQKNLQLLYKIPYINKKQKQGLVFELDYIDGKSVPDSTVGHKLEFVKSDKVIRTTKGAGVTYTYRKSFYLQHRIKYEYRYSTIADTLKTLNPNYFGEARSSQQYDELTYEIDSDHRDVAAYPLKGYEIVAGIQRAGILLNQDLQKTSAYVRAAGFLDMGKHFYLSNLAYVYWSSPNKLPYFNYSTMGYDKIFIRGYEIYVIEGPQFFLNKTTLKKRLFSRNWHLNNWKLKQFNYLPITVYLKTYADFGYVNNYRAYAQAGVNDFLTDRFLSGAGFGVDVVTGYDLAVRFEYSFTSQGNGFFLHFKKEF
jgi:outer membrane protein assembly factor BamA